jgi:hypothetical protein
LRKQLNAFSSQERRIKRVSYLFLVFGLLLSQCVAPLFFATCARATDPKDSQDLKTVIDLQPFRKTSSIPLKDTGGQETRATLINLNPHINAWYLLQFSGRGDAFLEVYHLENADPTNQNLLLDQADPPGLIITSREGGSVCELRGDHFTESLRRARRSGVPYAPLCGGKLYLRNPTKGHRTGIEAVTEFLRDKVPGGDEIVTYVRDTFFAYLYQRKAEGRIESKPMKALPPAQAKDTPGAAIVDSTQANRLIKPADLGIEIEEPEGQEMAPGAWYPAKGNPGIFVSVIVPEEITPEIIRSYPRWVSPLDSVEQKGLVYLVAFDLDRFELKYVLGTVHPEVDWSEHLPDRIKETSLPGPDGIGSIAPLVSTGLVDPMDISRTVATFTGGFKRIHGALRYGPLAFRNHGSHYGFVEDGVVFSELQPGLSTIYALGNGWADMKTWTEEDRSLLSEVRYARQNGVPLVTGFDEASRMSVPGPLVNRWGEGNWSGSVDKRLRTLRAGAALQELEGKRFLLYAFFWSATPSAMARVFQAYRCRYAMLLDMNALVHTYLAVYRRQGSRLYVQHLIQGMAEVDMTVKGQYVPRFLGFADDRDFFYLTRKESP